MANISMLRNACVASALALPFLAGCSGETATSPAASSTATQPEAAASATASTSATSTGSSGLSNAEACRRFAEITADYKMSDAESAVAFHDLAVSSATPAMRAAIEGVAEGFRQHRASISSEDVLDLCE